VTALVIYSTYGSQKKDTALFPLSVGIAALSPSSERNTFHHLPLFRRPHAPDNADRPRDKRLRHLSSPGLLCQFVPSLAVDSPILEADVREVRPCLAPRIGTRIPKPQQLGGRLDRGKKTLEVGLAGRRRETRQCEVCGLLDGRYDLLEACSDICDVDVYVY
jgi:hypothetical protein